MVGTSTDMLPSYLDEFMWRQRFGQNAFDNILVHIAEWFPVN